MPFLILITFAIVFTGFLCKADNCGQVYQNYVPAQDASYIVNKHNYLRNLILQGSVPGQPRGKNIKTLSWDNNLAAAAQNIANSCVFQHVKVSDGRFYVGQNLAQTWNSGYTSGSDWDSVIEKMWFDEYKNYHYPDNPSEATGHYTQVVWGDTYLVGCGYIFYKVNGRYYRFYVCNYGPGGNIIGQPPYQRA